MEGFLGLVGFASLAFTGFVIYFIFKQLQFVLQAINLYKDMVIRLERIIALLEGRNDPVGSSVSSSGFSTRRAAASPAISPEDRAAERARGILRCKRCDKLITPNDRKVCRDKELCEDHL